MKENMVYCRAHYELLMQGEYMPCLSPGLSGPPVTYYNGVGAVQKGRPRKRKSPEPETCLGLGELRHFLLLSMSILLFIIQG